MKHKYGFTLLIYLLLQTLAYGQTKVIMPKNNYPVSKDIELGNETAREIESESVILTDTDISKIIQSIGNKLISAIPKGYRNSDFQFSFKVVRGQEFNAFAIPGGSMYIYTGLIEQSQNEGQLASVMAHEISHVILRHGTAKATISDENKPVDDVFSDESICGVLGNLCGVLKSTRELSNATQSQEYSREFENQADTLGVQILKLAGYNPNEMVNMFLTMKSLQGNGITVPWRRSHPDTDERIQRTRKEISLIGQNYPADQPNRVPQILAKLGKLPKTKSENQTNSSNVIEEASVGYNLNVSPPSRNFKTFSAETLEISTPVNWLPRTQNDAIFFAPNGAFGDNGITHGIMFGIYKDETDNLEKTVDRFLKGILSANAYLKTAEKAKIIRLKSREFVQVSLVGTSPITKKSEFVTMRFTPLTNNILMHISTVSPESDLAKYNPFFEKVVNSLTIKTN